MIQCIDMIKTRIVLFLLAALLLTGCTSSESEVSTAVETAENTEADEEGAEVSQDAESEAVMSSSETADILEYRTDWHIEEREIQNFPDNASYRGSTTEGIYYCFRHDPAGQDLLKTFYFQPWSGEAVPLLEVSSSLYSTFPHGDWLFVSLLGTDGFSLVGLHPKEEPWEVFSCTGFVLPMLYGYDEKLLMLYIDDSSIPGEASEERVYKISRTDLLTRETEVLYETKNRLACVSESAAGVWFAEEDEDGQQTLCQYDAASHSIKRSVKLEKPVVFAAESNGVFYLSERGPLRENLGGIYQWEDTFERIGWVPFIAEDNIIWDGKCVGNLLLWKAQQYGYILDVDTQDLWVLHFRENEEQMKLRHLEDDGFSGIIEKDGHHYYRKYTIPSL